MNQHQLNHDQAQLKLDRLHHEARLRALMQRRREQTEDETASPAPWFVCLVGTLSRRIFHLLHLGSA